MRIPNWCYLRFFFNDTATTEIYTLSLHDALPIFADRIAALVKLRAKPRAERRLAVLLPDYPGAAGRAGYVLGLDVPARPVAPLSGLGNANYDVAGAPPTPRGLLGGPPHPPTKPAPP